MYLRDFFSVFFSKSFSHSLYKNETHLGVRTLAIHSLSFLSISACVCVCVCEDRKCSAWMCEFLLCAKLPNRKNAKLKQFYIISAFIAELRGVNSLAFDVYLNLMTNKKCVNRLVSNKSKQ